MGSILGKRKSRIIDESSTAEPEDARAIFQRHFEARFAPLPPSTSKRAPKTARADGADGSDTEDSEWGGISEDESEDEWPDEGE